MVCDELRADNRRVIIEHQKWTAEVNTQIIIINTLFKQSIQQFPFSDYVPNDSTLSEDLNNITIEQEFANMEKDIIDFRKRCIELATNQQKIMNELTRLVIDN